jgi:hypothetical protein
MLASKIGTSWGNPISEKRVATEISEALTAKGWTPAAGGAADALVVLHAPIAVSLYPPPCSATSSIPLCCSTRRMHSRAVLFADGTPPPIIAVSGSTRQEHMKSEHTPSSLARCQGGAR